MNLKNIKNDHLLEKFSGLVAQEKEATAAVVRYLSEILRRRLFALEGYSSLFSYLVEKYHYSKSAAYRRVQAAKLAQKCPEIIDYLKSGQLNLTTISLIEPHIASEQDKALIEKSMGKSKEEVESLLLSTAPKPEKHFDKIRRLPVIVRGKTNEQKLGVVPAAGIKETEHSDKDRGPEKPRDTFKGVPGLSEDTVKKQQEIIRRVKIEFVADERVAKKIERAKEILRHKYPKARLEDIFDEALEALLEKKDPARKLFRSKSAQNSGKLLQSKSAQPEVASSFPQEMSAQSEKKSVTRYVPHEIRRAVWDRDQGACVYQSPNGKKCGEKAALALDHVRPFALGGKATVENLQLLCKTHNAYRAQQTFGMFRY